MVVGEQALDIVAALVERLDAACRRPTIPYARNMRRLTLCSHLEHAGIAATSRLQAPTRLIAADRGEST